MSFYITTPLYYVNDLPHVGSAYPTMAVDFFTGHMLQRGLEVAFLTGTDEHGQKIEKAAKTSGKTPKEHCDYIAEEFKKLWQLLEIQYDYFRRTSNPEHHSFVQDFFKRVYDNGDIYKAEYKGLYCVQCEDFKSEKDREESVAGSKTKYLCPVHKQELEEYAQENYFFALSKYENKLKQYIDTNPDFIAPSSRKNEVLGWIKEGLKDFPISRVGIEWGITVPLREEAAKQQKIYVWFDALLGYISGLGEARSRFWNNNPGSQIVHIIGKDILRFHAVYWPAMLMSAGYPLPTKVFGHGFLTKDGMKMGKTLGNIIDPIALTQEFGADAVRFYFMREMVFGKDGDFTQESLIQTLNADLANNLGNLLNRCLNLIKKYFNNRIPDAPLDASIQEALDNLEQNFLAHMNELSPNLALDELFKTLNKVNAYVNDTAPWKLLKANPVDTQAASCLVTALEACRRTAIFLAPLCPNIAKNIFVQLGLATKEQLAAKTRRELLQKEFAFNQLKINDLGTRSPLGELEPLYVRREVTLVERL